MSTRQGTFKRRSINRIWTCNPDDPQLLIAGGVPTGTLRSIADGHLLLNSEAVCKLTIIDNRGDGTTQLLAQTMTWGAAGLWYWDPLATLWVKGAVMYAFVEQFDSAGTTLQQTLDLELYDQSGH